MKIFPHCLLTCLISTGFLFSQGSSGDYDFEDGTLQTWTNSDGTTTALSVESSGMSGF